MEAPEKIYIHIKENPREITWSEVEEKNCVNIEYIRKDIHDETIKTAEDHAYFAGQEKFREKLLEWANDELETAKLTDFDDYGHGELFTWNRIIEKIKEL